MEATEIELLMRVHDKDTLIEALREEVKHEHAKRHRVERRSLSVVKAAHNQMRAALIEDYERAKLMEMICNLRSANADLHRRVIELTARIGT